MPLPGWATASDRLLDCRLPVPDAMLTPMFPDAPLKAAPSRLAENESATRSKNVSPCVEVNLTVVVEVKMSSPVMSRWMS